MTSFQGFEPNLPAVICALCQLSKSVGVPSLLVCREPFPKQGLAADEDDLQEATLLDIECKSNS